MPWFLDEKESYCRNSKMLSWVMLIFFMGCFVSLIFLAVSCDIVQAEEEYSNDEIVEAIYQAEGGSKAEKAFGILSVNCRGYEECKKICRNTVKNNRKRFEVSSSNNPEFKRLSFLEFLSIRYAPIGAANDPKNLNQNWLKNVKFFLAKNREVAK